ncbi:nuclear transport factor 2 family protein [Archangium lansingense]|uniref:Nuclear transport factor 2 family protein n=1 Tax=Archangium lansingense TaxID=2995310 RepID=A0ABT4AMX6_9BACT|nr:nuclear transport factor 2 family protein [Archangium lansinium]MCY1083037.1 nuclear transport factor 2 family protein [Archangium lansinium]
MHPNAQLLKDFYAAFARRDGNAMAACYHPDAEFSDPVFPGLRHAGVTSMWRMLCERGTDLELTLNDSQADDHSGRAQWDARYTFSMSGKKVLNRVHSEFEFKDGKILRQTDRFGFWTWARQAIGPVGVLLGWSPLVRNKVQAQARRSLDKYMKEHGISGA